MSVSFDRERSGEDEGAYSTNPGVSWAQGIRIAAGPVPRLATAASRLFLAWRQILRAYDQQLVWESRSRPDGIDSDRHSAVAVDVTGQAYADMISTYRRFLRQCILCVRPIRTSPPEIPDDAFSNAFVARFPVAAEPCWTGNELQMCRAIRQSIRHNDSVDHQRLAPWKDRIRVVEGELLLDTVDIFRLYRCLKANVERMIVAVLLHPSRATGATHAT